MSELTTISSLLDDARKRKDLLDTAVSAFRDLPFEEQLRFLVTIEDEVVVASGAAGAVLALGSGKRPALPPAPAPEPSRPVAASLDPVIPLGPAYTVARKSKYGAAVVAQVVEHFDQGRSQGEITKLMNISYPTVNKMLRAAGRNTSARATPREGRKAPSADPEDSHPPRPRPIPRSKPSPSPSRSQAREPEPSQRPPEERLQNQRPLALGPLLSAAEELDLARRLEEAELAAWARVLEHPDIVANVDVGDEVRRLTEQRAGVPALAVTSTATLRRQDPNRRVLDAIVAIVRRDKRIDPEIRAEMAKLAADAHALRHRFVACNIRLVGKVSQKFFWTQLHHEDLMQEGLMGLMHSIGIYDYRRNLRFSTYATWWVKHFMLRSWENSAEVRIPVHINGTRSKIFGTTKRLSKELGRDPTETEIAAAAGMTLKQLRGAGGPGWWLIGASKSLDYELEDGGVLGDTFVDPNSEEVTALDHLISAENIELVTSALEQLEEREADIIRRRFGIGCEAEILADVGIAHGVSRERIRQLEKMAMESLRNALARSAGIGRHAGPRSRRSVSA